MSEETKPEIETPETYSKEFVEKVLNEKKNAMMALSETKKKVSEYEIQLKQVEEEKLLKERDFEALAERNKKEAEEWKNKHLSLETKLQTQVKVGAVKREFEKLGIKDGKTVENVLGLLKLDAIKYDEATQTVIGADEEVKRIKEALPQLFAVNPQVGAQHAAPQSTPSSISVDNYKAMMKDGSWNKLSKLEKQEYETKLWGSLGVNRKA